MVDTCFNPGVYTSAVVCDRVDLMFHNDCVLLIEQSGPQKSTFPLMCPGYWPQDQWRLY